MRIGYDTLVENPFAPSSAIYYLKAALRALVKAAPEHEFFVFVSPHNREFFWLEAPNVQFVNCFVSNEHIFLRIFVQQLYYPILARRFGLDVIHALNQIPLLISCATVVKTCSLHHHLFPQEYNGTLANRLRRAYRCVMFDTSARRATLVLANSEYTATQIAKFMGVAEHRIRVVLEAVDDGFGKSASIVGARESLRKQFNLTRDFVLYVSNLWFYKNPDGAIKAFGELRRRFGDDLDLVIAGRDDWRRAPELTGLASDLGIEDRVRFVGEVSRADLIRLYTTARVVFYPSLAETFGKPLIEAMKSGVPLVTSNVTSLPEVAGDAALVVDPTDVGAMADALHCAATDEALRAELITRGLERAHLFTWDRVAERTLAVCREAAAKKSRQRLR
jgi:glycosyltransferase involved in cell wall biosynthesis